jgi:hypothetical protein
MVGFSGIWGAGGVELLKMDFAEVDNTELNPGDDDDNECRCYTGIWWGIYSPSA